MAEKNILEERRTEHQYAMYGASHDQETTWRILYKGVGFAEVHSTIAERQTPQEVETMKSRVINISFIDAVHGCSIATTAAKFINAEWVCYIVNQQFDGGMIFPIIRKSKDYPKSSCMILQPTLHANDLIHYSPPYSNNHGNHK